MQPAALSEGGLRWPRRDVLRLNTPAAWLVWAIAFAILCLVYLSALFSLGDGGGASSGWFVTDGITLFNAALDDAEVPMSELFAQYDAAAGLAVLNAALVGTHSMLPAVFNFTLLLVVFGSLARYRGGWPVALMLLTPYYLVSLPLPSKDVVVLALFVLAVDWFASERSWRFVIASIIALATFFVRDGFAAILLLSFAFIAVVEHSKVPRPLALMGALLAASVFWVFFGSVFQESFLYVRAMGVAEQGLTLGAETSALPSGYLMRLLGNATNLAFRPVLFDTEGRIHVLSLSYWVSGITLLYALGCCLGAVRSPHARDHRLGMIGLLSLILVSVTPYVQPRYLLPLCLLVPAFSFASMRHLLRSFLWLVPMALAVSLAYRLGNNYPPAAEPVAVSLAVLFP